MLLHHGATSRDRLGGTELIRSACRFSPAGGARLCATWLLAEESACDSSRPHAAAGGCDLFHRFRWHTGAEGFPVAMVSQFFDVCGSYSHTVFGEMGLDVAGTVVAFYAPDVDICALCALPWRSCLESLVTGGCGLLPPFAAPCYSRVILGVGRL